MSTEHAVGYVGGLAVALGVAAAALSLGAVTASADASSGSTHSASAGTAKSARAPQRTNTVASMKSRPPSKVSAPTAALTLLTTTSVAPGPRRASSGHALRSAAAAYSPPSSVSSDGTRQLTTTVFTDAENRQNTTLTVTDTATGDPVGPALTVLGDAASSPAQFLTADGSRVLLTTAEYGYEPIGGGFVQGGFTTWVRVVDTATGTVIGDPVPVRGMPFGSPITTGRSRAVLTTYYDNPTSHKTSTRVAVIDTVAGRQVGGTTVVSGQPVSRTPVVRGNDFFLSRTHLGLGAVIDTRSGAALTIPVAFPWGVDLSPLSPVIFIGTLFFGVLVVAPVITVVTVVRGALNSIGLPV